MKIVGYSNHFSVAAGERVEIRVSTALARYQTDCVRLVSADVPDGGFTFVEAPTGWDQRRTREGRVQPLPMGSYMRVDDHPSLRLETGGTVMLWVCPTTPGARPQTMISKGGLRGGAGYALGLDALGSPRLDWVEADGRRSSLSTNVPLRAWSWYLVAATFDRLTGLVSLMQRPRNDWPIDPTSARVVSASPGRGLAASDDPLMVAASQGPGGRPYAHFDGRIETPTLLASAITAAAIDALARGSHVADMPLLVASWDFGLEIPSDRAIDLGPSGLDGTLVNLPTRAVTGHAWDGRTLDWTQDRTGYGAIHFHADDLEDAAWDVDVAVDIPQGAPSGIYAIRLTGADAEDHVPFVVRAAATPTAELLFLLSSNTYLAYGNQHGEVWAEVAARGWPEGLPDPYPMAPEQAYAIDNGLLSLYDVHADGSGVSLASWRRPILNLRPKLNDEPSPDGLGFPHGFKADLQVAGWLGAKGIAADIAADEDLDVGGADLLRRYRVLLTGTHPEYWTERMLDALASYLRGGGRVVYLGGNGFYWVTSYDPLRRHVIEVRRWGGSRAWTASPGEYHHSTTGELGGLWRERGRPPQRSVGVGFTAQGSGPARPYVRTSSSRDPRTAWIFEGIAEDEPIGPDGAVMGGAAGLEFDRADPALGTPPHAVVIASANGFSDAYQAAIEEVTISDSQQGGTVAPTVRADMVYFETPNGGAVFSTGSIAYGGAIVMNRGQNAASTVLENVLRTFLEEDDLPPPIGRRQRG